MNCARVCACVGWKPHSNPDTVTGVLNVLANQLIGRNQLAGWGSAWRQNYETGAVWMEPSSARDGIDCYNIVNVMELNKDIYVEKQLATKISVQMLCIAWKKYPDITLAYSEQSRINCHGLMEFTLRKWMRLNGSKSVKAFYCSIDIKERYDPESWNKLKMSLYLWPEFLFVQIWWLK